VVTNTEVAKLADHPEIVSLAQVPKILPEIPYETGVAKEEYIEKNPETIFRLAKALLEANRWIAANKAGTVEIAARLIKDESPEVLARAYDLGDPRLWGANGDMTEAAYKFTSDFLIKVGYMQAPIPYATFFDRRFVDRAAKELGRQ
jgi:ABC-type nitrate/sulfonate/bicarbonate transport system substrate-binding protein